MQSERCTLTPAPRVTNPTMSSPGTGVQHLASLTQMSSTPLTMTPGSPVRTRRCVDPGRATSARSSSLARLATHRLHEPLDDGRGGHLALADRGVQRRDVRVAHLVGDRDERLVRQEALDRQVLLAHRLGDGVLAVLDRLFAALLGEPLADLVAGARALDEPEPVAGRSGGLRLRREDVDDVPVLERRVERHEPAVDAGAHRAVPDLGVHGVREVHRRRTGRAAR